MSYLRPTVVAIAIATCVPVAASTQYRPERIGWSELHYQARKLGFSIDAQLRLTRVGAAELRAQLADPAPGGWLAPPVEGGWRLDLATSGLGRRSELALWIDREGRSLQRTQVEVGRRLKDHRNRTHRFGDGVVHVRTLRPLRGEEDAPPESWRDREDWTPPLPESLRPGQSTSLFYALAAGELNRPGDRLTTWIFAKHEVSEVELVVEARQLLEADFEQVSGGSTERRDESIPALRIAVSGRRLDDDSADSDFRFLGLHGTIHAFVDEATRAPLLITGRVSWLGRGRVELRRLVVADP